MDEESQPWAPFIKFFSQVIQKFINSDKLEFYDVQKEAIKEIKSKTLLICAPTGAGKTLIFILTFLEYLHSHYRSEIKEFEPKTEQQKQSDIKQNNVKSSILQFKVIFIAPTIAVCNQKFKDFQQICRLLRLHHKINLKVFRLSVQNAKSQPMGEIYFDNNIFICTPEMANALYRKAQNFQLNLPKLFLCDEIHLLGDKRRGPILEMVVTRTLYYQQKEPQSLRIVCVSATVKNIEQLGKWMKGKEIVNGKRQVTLKNIPQPKEFKDKFALGMQYNKRNVFLNILQQTFKKYKNKCGPHQKYLIFCFAKTTAKSACKAMFLQNNSYYSFKFTEDIAKQKQVQTIIDNILDFDLKQCIYKRVAFHHAHMCEDDKNNVIKLMKQGWVLAIFCTSTLAQGVNLPVQVIIIMGLNKMDQIYTKAELEQMIGRGGRQRSDKTSYCTLIAHKDIRQQFDEEIMKFVDKDQQEGPIFSSHPQIKSNVSQNFDEFLLFELVKKNSPSVQESLQYLNEYFFKHSLWAEQLRNGRSDEQVKSLISAKLKTAQSQFQQYDLTGKILKSMYYCGISVKSYKQLFNQISRGSCRGGFNELKFLETVCNIDQIVMNFRFNQNQDSLGQYKKHIKVTYPFKCRSKNQIIKGQNKKKQQRIRRKKNRSKAIFLLQVYLKGDAHILSDHLFEEAEQIAKVVRQVCLVCQKIYSLSKNYQQSEKQSAGFVFWNEVYLKYLSLLSKSASSNIQITKDNYKEKEERASHLNIKKCWTSIMPTLTPQQIANLSKMNDDTQNPNFFQIIKTGLIKQEQINKLKTFDLRKSQNEQTTFIVDNQSKLKYFVFQKQNDTFKLYHTNNDFQHSPKIKLKQTNNKQYVIIVYEKVLGTDAIYIYESGQAIKKFEFPQDYNNNVENEYDVEDEDNGDDDSNNNDQDRDDQDKDENEKMKRRRQNKSAGKSSSLDKTYKKVKE